MLNNTSADIINGGSPQPEISKTFKVIYLLVNSTYVFLNLNFQYVIEGILMTSVACLGIISNLISFLYFVYQKYHKTFHRSVYLLLHLQHLCAKSRYILNLLYCRLLLVLGLVDTIHLIFSVLSFSLPALSENFKNSFYPFTFPYTFPLAQVPQKIPFSEKILFV